MTSYLLTVWDEPVGTVDRFLDWMGGPGVGAGAVLQSPGPPLMAGVPSAALESALDGVGAGRVDVTAAAPAPGAAADDAARRDPFIVLEPDPTEAEIELAQGVLAMGLEEVGAWSWRMATDVVTWSPELEALHGFGPGEFGGNFAAFAQTIHPEDRDRVLDEVAGFVAEGRDLRNIYRFLRSDGSVGWIRGIGRLLRDGTGRPVAMAGIGVDETELVTQREALREQRDELAGLLHERQELAEMLQQTLLPAELPHPGYLAVSAAYRAATGSATGDFYDLFPTTRLDEWFLTVGDVAGHGPEAAVLTGSVRRSLHSAALLASNPGEVLMAANGVHASVTKTKRFATVQAALFRRDPDGAVDLLLGTAGHPPALLLRADGDIEWLSGTGPPLGVVPDPDYTTRKTRLSSGDALVLYTDGVTEAGITTDAGAFGERRLATAARASLNRAAPSVADGVLDAVAAHTSLVRDDAAVVAVRIL